MTPSLELFNLIRSLTKAEKRSFKLSSQLYNYTKDYIQLFDLIEQQGEYDETFIKSQLKNTPLAKRFPVAKNYLFNQIIKSLESNISKNNHITILKKELIRATLLKERGLLKSSEKLFKTIKEKAKQYEAFELLLEIIDHQYFFLPTNHKNINHYIDTLQAEAVQVQKRLNSYYDIYSIHQKVVAFVKKNEQARSKDLDKLKGIFDPKHHNTDKYSNSFKSSMFCNLTHNMYYYLTRQYNDLNASNKSLITLLESKKYVLQIYNKRYIHAIANQLLICIRIKDFSGFKYYLKKAHNINPSNNIEAYERFIAIYQNQLLFYCNQGLFKDATTLCHTIKADKSFIALHNYDRLIFEYMFAYSFFGNNQFHNCVEHINHINNFLQTSGNKRFTSYTKLLEVIAHWELNNHELLENIIASIKRQLNKNDELYDIEKLLIKMIQKLLIAPESTRIKIFKDYHQKLSDIIALNDNALLLDFIQILCWIESKTTKKPFAICVKNIKAINEAT